MPLLMSDFAAGAQAAEAPRNIQFQRQANQQALLLGALQLQQAQQQQQDEQQFRKLEAERRLTQGQGTPQDVQGLQGVIQGLAASQKDLMMKANNANASGLFTQAEKFQQQANQVGNQVGQLLERLQTNMTKQADFYGGLANAYVNDPSEDSSKYIEDSLIRAGDVQGLQTWKQADTPEKKLALANRMVSSSPTMIKEGAKEERFQTRQDLAERKFAESTKEAEAKLAQRQLETQARLKKLELSGGKLTQEQARMQRAINALGGVSSAVETINEFEIGTNVGALPSLTTHDGMINAVRNYAGRAITPTSADQLNTVFQGIGRNLASIETSGLATGLAELSKSLQSGVYINPGKDDAYAVAFKLADIKRIAEENIKPAISAGLLSPDQEKTAEKLMKDIDKYIPYTTVDVAKATRKAMGTGKPTIAEATKKAVGKSESIKAKDGNTYSRPANFTDKQWEDYKKAVQ